MPMLIPAGLAARTPTRMWTKICANTNLADAQLAAELGADAIGFVFAPSKRQVTVEQVAAITPHLPDGVETVGVFHALDAAELIQAVDKAGLTALQLHAAHRPELVRALIDAFEGHVKLIQVVQVPVEGPVGEAMAELAASLRDPGLFAVLLDAAKAGASGGLGVTFSWQDVATRVSEEREWATAYAESQGTAAAKLVVAGGLQAANVREAIAALRPDGVDVASGVEEEPGRKSPGKLRAFLEAARGRF